MKNAAVIDDECEVFKFARFRYDISRLLGDLAAGSLASTQLDLSPEFVSAYAERFLALRREDGAAQARCSFFVSVDAARAIGMPEEVLDNPVIILELDGAGLFSLSGDAQNPCNVVGDGNHRIARAYFDDRSAPIRAHWLDAASTAKYLIN